MATVAAKKITELNPLYSVSPSDMLVVVHDPSGAAETMQIIFSDVMGNVRVSSVFNESATFTNGVSIANTTLTVTGNVSAARVVSNTIVANTSTTVGNVVINTTSVSVGNSTVNTVVHQGYLRFGNSALSQINSSSIVIPTVVATELFVANTFDVINPGFGANGYISVGNTTVNATVNSSSFHLRTSLGNVAIYSGSATTRSGVLSQVGSTAANGSLYLSTAGKMYLRVNNANSATDWQKVTTTAAD
jgi:hypothetical protein